MPADLVSFMRWIGLLEVAAQPKVKPVTDWGNIWFKDGDCPF